MIPTPLFSNLKLLEPQPFGTASEGAGNKTLHGPHLPGAGVP